MANLFSESTSLGKWFGKSVFSGSNRKMCFTNLWNGCIKESEPAPVPAPTYFSTYRAVVEDYLKNVTDRLPESFLYWFLFGLIVLVACIIIFVAVRIVKKMYGKTPDKHSSETEQLQESDVCDRLARDCLEQNGQSLDDCEEELPQNEQFEIVFSRSCFPTPNSPDPAVTLNARIFRQNPHRRSKEDKSNETSPSQVNHPPSVESMEGHGTRFQSRIPVSVSRLSSPKLTRYPKED